MAQKKQVPWGFKPKEDWH